MDPGSEGWSGRRPRMGCTGCCVQPFSTGPSLLVDSCARGTSRWNSESADPPSARHLTRLEEEGLIVKFPFRGAFVVEVSAQDVAEIASVRLLVEPYAWNWLSKRCAVPSGPG